MVDINEIQKWLSRTIENYKNNIDDNDKTCWLILDTDNNGNDLAIVCGWTNAFEDNGVKDWNEDGAWL